METSDTQDKCVCAGCKLKPGAIMSAAIAGSAHKPALSSGELEARHKGYMEACNDDYLTRTQKLAEITQYWSDKSEGIVTKLLKSEISHE